MTEENTSAGPAWTAGPWRVEVIAGAFYICDGEEWPDGQLARANIRDGLYEREANARLISAAPDLYEALERCALVLAGEVSHKSGLVDALEAARAALTKARGQ